jgi:hypothetical protein
MSPLTQSGLCLVCVASDYLSDDLDSLQEFPSLVSGAEESRR